MPQSSGIHKLSLSFYLSKLHRHSRQRWLAAAAVWGVVLNLLVVPHGLAETVSNKINNLNQQQIQNQAAQVNLQAQADSLSNTIASLHAQISTLESQIKYNKTKNDQLRQSISKNQAELDKQKSILRQNVRTMYLDSDVTTIEMLASSKNLSEFVDKEQYRQAVTAKVNLATGRINSLQKQLQQQKSTVEKILVDQQAMSAQLAAQRVEATRLMNMTRSQQLAYEARIRQINNQVAALRLQQAKENSRFVKQEFITGGTGGYPWADTPFPNSLVDPWGMFQRQCVSYTAWKVASSQRYMPFWGGRGNANQWDDNARQAGIPVDNVPQPGDVAISNAGTYGHAMYVEAVNDDGTITISQYNAAWDGRYSIGRINPQGLSFIHF